MKTALINRCGHAALAAAILFCLALPRTGAAVCFKQQSYDDCLLEGLKGTSSDVAAKAISYACADKFPSKGLKTLAFKSPESFSALRGEIKIGVDTGSGTLSGNLYNGLPFRVAKVVIAIQPKGVLQASAHMRRVAIETNLPSSSSSNFCLGVDSLFAREMQEGYEWYVLEAWIVPRESQP